MPSTRKILMLHGYGQNAYFMSRYTADFVKENEDIEFVYLDAPHRLVPVDLVSPKDAPSPDTAFVCNVPTASPPESESPRGWFTIVNFGGNTMEGVWESLALLKKTLSENTFEAIMGFSQGAAMAELLAAMLEHPDLYSEMTDDNGIAVHPPLKYIVSVSGFLLRGRAAAWDGAPVSPEFPDPQLETPILHVLGDTDLVVPRERALIFGGFHNNKRVERHIGGHFVPRQTKWRSFFTEFFQAPFGEIASPTPVVMRKGYGSFKIGHTLVASGPDRSSASTPDSLGPMTPIEEIDAEPLLSGKSLVVEELASMWEVYDGLVYRG